jgi:trans-aconitate methyltransferase
MSINQWDAQLYDDQLHFVSTYGKEVLGLLQPRAGESILDLGCGTGDLTFEIAQAGAEVQGIDLAEEMIRKAKKKYPELSFSVENAETYKRPNAFDAVFSNAALHWIKNAEQVVANVWVNLRPNGRFVAEFGGKGNVRSIVEAIDEVLKEYGRDLRARNPWYFPSIGEFSGLLERQGFRVRSALHFDRPTVLPGGEKGLKHWLDMFGDDFFFDFTDEHRKEIFEKIERRLRPRLFDGNSWTADYRRLRIWATKE